MSINKINGEGGIGPVGGVKPSRKVDSGREAEKKGGKDRVEFSSVLQEVNRAKESASSSDAERAEKIRSLREQIEAGTYRPDPEKVAASLLKFLSGKK